MSMKSNNADDIKNKFRLLLSEHSEQEGVEHDAYILMSRYLSEIDRIQDEIKITRKDLAREIKISPSYLTQVFRGDKPLNFVTIAKIQRALNIKFEVKAKPYGEFGKDDQTVFVNRPQRPIERAIYFGHEKTIVGNDVFEKITDIIKNSPGLSAMNQTLDTTSSVETSDITSQSNYV